MDISEHSERKMLLLWPGIEVLLVWKTIGAMALRAELSLNVEMNAGAW